MLLVKVVNIANAMIKLQFKTATNIKKSGFYPKDSIACPCFSAKRDQSIDGHPSHYEKRYWCQKHSPVGKAVFSLLDSWTCTSDKKDMNSVSFYDYTKSWTETIVVACLWKMKNFMCL